jgi:hypothetical protein
MLIMEIDIGKLKLDQIEGVNFKYFILAYVAHNDINDKDMILIANK